MFRLFIGCVCLLIALSAQAYELSHYSCDFNRRASVDGIKNEELHLDFITDRKTLKSYALGNNGPNPVGEVLNNGGVSFIEITGSGNVIVTTIQTKIGEAVHSRNVIIGDKLAPQQFYGVCKLN